MPSGAERMVEEARGADRARRAGLSRRRALQVIGAAAATPLALGFGGPLRRSARPVGAAANSEAVIAANLGLAPEMAPPPDLGQTTIAAYVPETGHTVRGILLEYWRATGAASVYGNPITEPFASPEGYYSQAFENGVLQYRPEFRWTDDPFCRLAHVGPLALAARADDLRADGRRDGGGGDPRVSVWQPVDPNGQSAANAVAGGGRYFEDTGHTLTDEFLAWWQGHEGHFYLGSPISQQLREAGQTVQYFQGGKLASDGTRARPAPIGREVAARLGIETAPVAQDGLPVYDEALFLTAPNPYSWYDTYAPGPKTIEVSIDDQMLWARQGDVLVLESYVSTGISPNGTEHGRFHVRIKRESEDMGGFESNTGEVVGVITEDGVRGAETGRRYAVEDVPNVMYVNFDAEALHGAYWHNNFGVRMSHGCINLPLDVAAFLFGWAALGSPVWVHGSEPYERAKPLEGEG
jgi:hypothetical protein